MVFCCGVREDSQRVCSSHARQVPSASHSCDSFSILPQKEEEEGGVKSFGLPKFALMVFMGESSSMASILAQGESGLQGSIGRFFALCRGRGLSMLPIAD